MKIKPIILAIALMVLSNIPVISQVTFSDELILSSSAREAMFVYAADLDNDGDQDIIAASMGNNSVSWFENTDGNGTFSAEKVISAGEQGISSAISADLDGDNDMDIVTSAYLGDRISWYKNINGTAEFELAQEVSNTVDGAISIFIADIDGDNDILAALPEGDKVVWYENRDAKGSFSNQSIISTNAQFAHCVYSADIDGDNDFDILSASWGDHKIAWFRNELISVGIDRTMVPQNQYLKTYPNPFNVETFISLTIPLDHLVDVGIYITLGEKVKSYHIDKLTTDNSTITWDGRNDYGQDSDPGMYYYVLHTKEFTHNAKILYLK